MMIHRKNKINIVDFFQHLQKIARRKSASNVMYHSVLNDLESILKILMLFNMFQKIGF